MKRFLPLLMLIAATVVVSCKSTTGPGVVGLNTTPSGHGVDAAGDVWMSPPPVGQGIQLSVLPFVVPDSSEVQGNFYFDFPSDVDFQVARIEIAMNEGTHHMNCFKSPLTWPQDSGVGRPMVMRRDNGKIDTIVIRYQPQFNSSIVWNASDMMVEAQIPYLNWVLPKLNVGPDAGKQTVVKLPATQHMIIENHYVNKALVGGGFQTTPSGHGAIIINLWKTVDADNVTASMMVAKKTTIVIPPNSDVTFSKDCKFTAVDPASWPIYILGMTGHYHSRGKSFTVDKMQEILDASGVPTGVDTVIQAKIYQNASWSEPPFTSYDPPVQLKLGQYLRYTTEYVNNSGNTFVFGPHVATDEHCNLFSWFVPSWHDGQTVYDNQN
jgi:hypothetical protein